MTDEIAALVGLREVDRRIMNLRKVVGMVPGQIAELTRKVELLTEDMGKRKAQLDELRIKRRTKEREIDDFSERIRKSEFQQFQVKTNKEYQALLHEIALLKEKRSHVEGEIIELMEYEENSAKDIEELERKLATDEALAAQEKRQLEQELDDGKREMEVVSEQKQSLLSRMSPPVRLRYERIAGGKGGIAIAAIRNRACGACFTGLPLQTVNEIRKGTKIISCETCGRMLVWVDESGQ